MEGKIDTEQFMEEIRKYDCLCNRFSKEFKATAHRWLSWLSTGLSRGRSWVQLRPDQHSGSLNNWEESAAFVITSANG